jgi:cell shape-determining protein MreC
MLHRAVDIVFLILALTILSILFISSEEQKDFQLFEKSLAIHKDSTRKLIDNHLIYLEGRLNSVAYNQDTYQVSTSKRIDILETRIRVLQDENKELKQSRVLNYNNNVNTLNGKVQ